MKNVQSAHDAFLDREQMEYDERVEHEYDQDFDPEARQLQLEQDAAGRDIIFGEPLRLLLDLDTPEQRVQYEKMLPHLKRFFGQPEDISEWKSASGNTHIAIRLQLGEKGELDRFQRIALQAILGSDPMKELLSVLRGINMPDVEPTVLFCPRKKGE